MSAYKPTSIDGEWECPEDQIIFTGVKYEHGFEHEQRLIRKGNLFFLPDMSMYVYYTPTHWRHL